MGRGLLIYLLFNILALCACSDPACDKPNDRLKVDGDCTKYIECGALPGLFTEKQCPHGTGFKPDTKTCMWRDSIEEGEECFKDGETSISCTTGILTAWDEMRGKCVPEGTIVAAPDKRPDCDNPKYQNKFIADPEDCAGYYRCQGDVRIRGSCDADLYNFDPINQYCALKANLPCPVGSGSSQPTCEEKDAGTFVADENICTAYLLCNGDNTGRQEFCAEGLYFNDDKCVKDRPDTCSCENWDGITKGEFAHEDVTKYWKCNNGKREERTCPPDTNWNQQYESCEIIKEEEEELPSFKLN